MVCGFVVSPLYELPLWVSSSLPVFLRNERHISGYFTGDLRVRLTLKNS